MTHRRKVSVIIPTYNRASQLPKAIESVLTQTYQDFEIIVVDDGSTDDTKEVLEPYIQAEKIWYFYQKNQKQAAARNNGIKAASGQYIAFLDSDDAWVNTKLEKQVRVLEENNEISMVSCNQFLNNDRREVLRKRYDKYESCNILKDVMSRRIYISFQACLVRSEVLRDVGPFDVSLKDSLEDWELSLRIAKKYKIHLQNEPLCFKSVAYNPTKNYEIYRCRNHEVILERHLTQDIFELPFIRRVRGGAYFSWGSVYFRYGMYNLALQKYSRAVACGHTGALLSIPLCLSGRLGYGLFSQLMRIKSLAS
jgi:glycosyltransferase involved in cell wall biosynthesis